MPTEKEYMLEEATAAVTYQPKLTAGRNINISEDNVISSSGGQGGSVVTVTPNQMSGNLIATVTVDSTSYNLYSPLPQVMTGATSEVRGEQGLVPAPSIGYQDYVLYGDGTWKDPDIPSIIANPSTSAIRDLTKISIDGIVYDISSGSSGSEVVECTQDEYDALPSSKLTDNKIYCISGTKELDSNYNYYKYGENDEIVVRVYHEGESDENIIWFFRGWNQTSATMSIPSSLINYAPSNNTVRLTANFPNGDTIQDGWVGFRYGYIAAWSQNQGELITGYMYGVFNVTSSEDEQTNPYEDNPYVWISSSIKKIVVNGTEYGNTGGGSGSGTEITTLLDVQSATSPMNLTDDLFNYDTIFLEIKDSNGYARGISYASSILDIGQNIGFDNTYGYTWNEITSGTILTNISRNNFYISSIVGIKSFSGGGEDNEVIPLTQEEYDDLPSSKLTDNKAYFVKQSKTLDPNYEYHEYEGARGGKIVARVNLTSNEIDWFFVDYTFVGGTVEYLPSTLSTYFPTSSISGEAYDDEDEFVGMIVINNRGGFGLYPRDYSHEIAGTVRCLLHNIGGTDQINAYEEPYVWIVNEDYKIIVNGENYVQTSGGGGSDIIITPSLSSGLKIADYEIDETSGSIYIPIPVNLVELSKNQYDNLTPQEKLDSNKIYFVYDE